MTQQKKQQQIQITFWMILLFGSLTAFGPLSMDMYLPALPTIAQELHTSTSLIQGTLTATLLGMAAGQLVFGPLSDIHGRRNPIRFTLLGYAIFSIGIAFSTSVGMMIALRFLQGFMGAASVVITRAAARDMFSGKELTKFIALLSLINGAAPILAPIIGSFILQFLPWTGIFYVLGAFGLILLVAVQIGFKETHHQEHRTEASFTAIFKVFGELFRDRTFMGIAFTQALIMSGMFAYIAGSPFVLQNVYGVSSFQFSLFFAANGIGIILAAQLAAKLAEHFKEIQILQVSIFISLFATVSLLASFYLDASLWLIAVFLWLAVACIGSVSTTGFSIAMDLQGERAGSASALLGLLPFFGGAIVSPLVGIAGDATAFPMAWIMVSCSVLAVFFFGLSKKRQTVKN